jgi:dTDP-4-amino-4,6-dideoxygalactose transaminase
MTAKAMPVAAANLLAIVGGSPAFEQLLPIVSPEGLPGDDFLRDVEQILTSRQLTNAAFVRRFEDAAAEYLGVPHCVAVSSCTAGLVLLLRALGLRGEVILPSFTFHASAHSVLWNGLVPVFADCDARTFCLDTQSVRERLSPATAAILAVHIFGCPADAAALEGIAAGAGVPLLFDAAHAFGSAIAGKRVAGFGAAEVFSFSPTKLLVAGEGGLVATRDAALARLLRAARNYGDAGSYDPDLVGLNARMSEFHAALALRGLPGLDARIARRNEVRRRYIQGLEGVPGLRFQHFPPAACSTCKDFALLVDEAAFGASRDWLYDALRRDNIDARRYFSPPVHRQRLYQHLWDARPLPVTEQIAASVLNLPIYSSLNDAEVDRVCDAVARAQEFVPRLRDAAAREHSA